MKSLFAVAWLFLVYAAVVAQPLDLAIAENRTMFVLEKDALVVTPEPGKNSSREKLPVEGVHSIRAFKNYLFLAGKTSYAERDPSGKFKVLLDPQKLSSLLGGPVTINALGIDASGNQFLVVENERKQTALLRHTANNKLSIAIPFAEGSALRGVTQLATCGESALLVHSAGSTNTQVFCLMRKQTIGTMALGDVRNIVHDNFGRLHAIDTATHQAIVYNPMTKKTHPSRAFGGIVVALDFRPSDNKLVVINNAGHTLDWHAVDPDATVEESPLPFAVAPAFPNIEWTGWEPVNDRGVPVPLRPIILTHANDQSGRTFVATQHGVIHVFPKADPKKTQVFLDIQKNVTYKDSQNEEGFLGMAFHPRYKENGEFFVYYTKKPTLISIISRFKVKKDNPNQADPASEEVLLTIKQPMWNHNGGTLAFGPDGYLYIGMGDGGGANDMFKNSRKMNTFHSKILRIDVDSKSDGKPYGIPKDNPFVGQKDAYPEIFAFGVRNVWRMSFDRQTGQGWFADVGQNLYEEINLLQKGGDYGWNPRESFHPFGDKSELATEKMLEPIWEYHHYVGKSITGGFVYRGKQFPELQGMYLYADYVSNRIWALNYDFEKKRVVANREIGNRNQPIMSFGEDEDGELYLLTFSASGQGVDRLVRK